METSKRRLSCPLTVQYIWDSIASLRVQRQVANKDRIYKILSRQYNMTLSDVERQLKYAVRDNLINCVHRVGCKGSRRGVEAESYWFNTEDMARDGFDWYCFECHRSGEVYTCATCFRVYHPFCIKEDVSTVDQFVCPVCKLLKSESAFKIAKDELNVLLGYTCNRLKEKPTKESAKQSPLNEDEWRQKHLIYSYVDLAMMEQKAIAGQYGRLEEYQVDAQTIVHNVVIYYGVHSSYADLARQMLRDCNYDLTEIQQCRDCYRMSNEKGDKFWFCQPCNPPHELVYAKQRGYPYWPAKVIRKFKTTYDVRFFGGFHQRAKVEKVYIRPISTNVHSLQIKRSSAWNRAMEELKRHTTILERLKLEPISTVDADVDSETDTEDDTKAKRPYVKLEKISDMDDDDEMDYIDDDENDNEHSIHSEQESDRAHKSDQDDMNVVSSSSQVAGGLKSRSCATQTGNWRSQRKSCSCQSFTEQPSSSRGRQHVTNHTLKERIEAEFIVTKEAALRELAIKMDKKHFEDTAILTNNEKEKRKQLEERLNEAHKKEIAALNAKHLQTISAIKKEQWCWNCESEAIYHCCWNTSYCSVGCQQSHWQKEHKFTCRHKRT